MRIKVGKTLKRTNKIKSSSKKEERRKEAAPQPAKCNSFGASPVIIESSSF